MFSIIYNYFEKKKLKQSKYTSYPFLKQDVKVNMLYNCFTNCYQWYY